MPINDTPEKKAKHAEQMRRWPGAAPRKITSIAAAFERDEGEIDANTRQELIAASISVR